MQFSFSEDNGRKGEGSGEWARGRLREMGRKKAGRNMRTSSFFLPALLCTGLWAKATEEKEQTVLPLLALPSCNLQRRQHPPRFLLALIGGPFLLGRSGTRSLWGQDEEIFSGKVCAHSGSRLPEVAWGLCSRFRDKVAVISITWLIRAICWLRKEYLSRSFQFYTCTVLYLRA